MKLEIKDRRFQNIIIKAEQVFFEKGYAKTSISDICKAVNCSRTTLYSHFDNKENVYLAVVNRAFKSFLDFFGDLQLEGKSGLDKMLEYAKGYINYSKQQPKSYLMILDFYTLLKKVNSKKLQSDTDILLAQCSFFSKVKRKAELPFTFLINILKEGQEDGSIKSDVSAEILFLNIWAYLIGSSNLYDLSEQNQNTFSLVKIVSVEENILYFVRKILM